MSLFDTVLLCCNKLLMSRFGTRQAPHKVGVWRLNQREFVKLTFSIWHKMSLMSFKRFSMCFISCDNPSLMWVLDYFFLYWWLNTTAYQQYRHTSRSTSANKYHWKQSQHVSQLLPALSWCTGVKGTVNKTEKYNTWNIWDVLQWRTVGSNFWPRFREFCKLPKSGLQKWLNFATEVNF